MADSVEVHLNSAGFAAMALGPEVRHVLMEVGKKGKAFAESISPRDTGEYASSFELVEGTTLTFGRTPHAEVLLRNTAPYAAAVEWGNGEHAAAGQGHRVLGRTAAALGGL